ncbi:unnamed protein product [Candidula unifasciata]|uniref:G-protein coupled receptors family 1 profile domain-containing protein n=1 Tax=Candidula unifasciata TaxID=100452 RepID=A0A8S3YXC3_9EUPU|nr:unnamed protein product [Candidula unifasciata]
MYNITADEYTTRRKELWIQGYSYLFYVAKVLVMTISIGLNVTVLVTIKLSKRLRTIPCLYMVSLAVSDLTFSCNGIFHSTIVIIVACTHDWPSYQMANTFGTSVTFVFFFSIFSTYGNLILISLERWVYISQPFWYQRVISHRLAVFSIACIWIASTVVNVDILITGDDFPVINKEMVKYGIIFPALHFIWCVIICSIYIHIAVITLRHIKAMKKTAYVCIAANTDNEDLKLMVLKKKMAHVRMLLFVFGSFFLLLTPTFCCNIYATITKKINGDLMGFAKLLMCAHSCSNFFVYAFQDKEFKRALGKLFGKYGFGRDDTKVYPKQVYSSTVGFDTGHSKTYPSFD